MEIWPGSDYPLGATYDGIGTNFSVFSEVAQRVELCLFDNSGGETHVDLPEENGICWHGYLPGVFHELCRLRQLHWPRTKKVHLALERRRAPMAACKGGWWRISVPAAQADCD